MTITVYPANALSLTETIAQGLYPGAKLVFKFGRNGDAASGAWETVWGDSSLYTFPSSASTLEVISSSTNDTAAGSGAREITIEGLDSNWDEASEAVATNGTSASTATSTSFIRVNRTYVSAAGTYNGANEGTITTRISSAGATQSIIELVGASNRGVGQSTQAFYTIPDGYKGWLTGVEMYVESTKNADFAIYQRAGADDTTAPVNSRRLIQFYDGVVSEYNVNYLMYPGPFAARTDLWAEVYSNSANTQCSFGFGVILLPA